MNSTKQDSNFLKSKPKSIAYSPTSKFGGDKIR